MQLPLVTELQGPEVVKFVLKLRVFSRARQRELFLGNFKDSKLLFLQFVKF